MNLKYSFLVLLIGCGEKAVTINNTAPEVTITSHEDGDVDITLLADRQAADRSKEPRDAGPIVEGSDVEKSARDEVLSSEVY